MTFRACRAGQTRDECGPASSAATGTPVDTRATVGTCTVGSPLGASLPRNAGSPVTSVVVTFVGETLPGGRSSTDAGGDAYTTSSIVPEGATSVEVKATVDGHVDPGAAIARCAEAPAPSTTGPTPDQRAHDRMSMTPEQATWFSDVFGRLVAGVDQVLLGKTFVVRLSFTAMLSEGHLLLEDVPGTGKTSLARAIAQSVQGTSSRVQFTPDLLPGDITGVSIYDQRRGEFEFHRGPVFANVVLADEINRASPKTQSALLEVMEEGRVTVDGISHDVGRPFMVIATQNPVEQAGTYRLPEAQLDRFIMKTSIGYPDHAATVRILAGSATRVHEGSIPPVVRADVVTEMAQLARTVHVEPSINDYVARLVEATRTADEVRLGVSVRGALALVRCAKTYAASSGRHYVVPDDVKSLAEPVLAHRIVLDPEAEFDGVTPSSVVSQLLIETPPPAERVAV
nr:hypothetical protein GCM10025699_49700 [Microbacterium flavescens]